ncbi:MAG TPA: ribbon-helix-helix domain-containing protein [Terriglobales bacterium]|jgi:Arc/MetJ-type ribon-helix-helix transcriptional regulator|nr:ribbon-helix-helix domain-containing protein [Terriglobales bacterium]
MPNRVHIVIPKELTDQIDSVVSERSRSAFICDAVREKLVREKQVKALERLKSRPFKGGPKEWDIDSAGWVRRLRTESAEIRARRLRKNNH